jgi:hypothetical protein
MNDDWLDLNPDPAHVNRERAKARALRATDWWRAQIAKGVCHYCGRETYVTEERDFFYPNFKLINWASYRKEMKNGKDK